MGFRWSRTDADMGAGFLRIAREQIDKALTCANDGALSPAKRIHEARRRCKKLRGLLRLVRPDFPHFKEENTRIRVGSGHLSATRDAKVVQQTLVALMQWAGRPEPEFPIEATDEETERQALEGFGEEMRALRQRTEHWTITDIDQRTIETGLAFTYRGARRARKHARTAQSDEAFHDWRKLTKYHWHHLRLIENLAGDVLGSETNAASELAELLGLHHDLAVLRQLVEEAPDTLGVEVDAGFVSDATQRRQTELEQQIEALGAQVFAEKPKALKARFAAYLDTWQSRQAAA